MNWLKLRFQQILKPPTIPRPETSEVGSKKRFYGSFCVRGRRNYMEDTHFVIPCLSSFLKESSIPPKIELYGIFDGHGGPVTSAYAKEQFPKLFGNFLKENTS